MRSGIMRFLLGTILALCMCMQGAYAEVSAAIEADEWTWEPDGTAVFRGTVRRGDEDGNEFILQLEIATDPSDAEPGSVQFTALNENKLTIRHQSSEIRWHAEDDYEASFSGSWFLPAETGIQKISILLRVLSADGTVLAESTLDRISDENSSMRIGRLALPGDPDRIRTIVLIAGGVLWAAAAARILMNAGKKKKRQRG